MGTSYDGAWMNRNRSKDGWPSQFGTRSGPTLPGEVSLAENYTLYQFMIATSMADATETARLNEWLAMSANVRDRYCFFYF